MSEKIDKMADGVFESIKGYIKSAIDPRDAKLRELELRIAALESRPSYVGIHEEGKQYLQNDICTKHGSLWLCKELSTTERPGTDAWRQITKTSR